QEVADHLAQPHRIDVHREVTGGVHDQLHVLGPGSRAVRGGGLPDQVVQAYRLRVEVQCPGVGGGQHLEVVDDVLEQMGLLLQRGEEGGVGFGDSVLCRVQPAADVGERGAQFVR